MYDRRVVALRPSRAKSAIDVSRKETARGLKRNGHVSLVLLVPHGVLDVQTRDGQVSAARASRCKQVKPRAKWVTCGSALSRSRDSLTRRALSLARGGAGAARSARARARGRVSHWQACPPRHLNPPAVHVTRVCVP